MPRSSLYDPYKNFNWRLEIDSVASAYFSDCTGIKRSTDSVEYNEGGQNQTPYKSPGRTKYDDIVIKRGIIPQRPGASDLLTWARQVAAALSGGSNALDFRRNVDIVILNRDLSIGTRVRVYQAWPKDFQLGDLNSGGNESWMETMTIAHEGWDFVTGTPS